MPGTTRSSSGLFGKSKTSSPSTGSSRTAKPTRAKSNPRGTSRTPSSKRLGAGGGSTRGSSGSGSSKRSMTSSLRSTGSMRRTASGAGSALKRSGTRSKNVKSSAHSARSLATRGSAKKDTTDRRAAALKSTEAAGAATSRHMEFTVDDVKLSTTLGTGSFGRVRLCQHKKSGKHYALKILKKAAIIRLKQVDHIKNELKILKMIMHPFIVNLMGHTQTDTHLCMLLEYVPGGELFSYLRRENRFSNDTAKFYAAQIALAFQHLHGFRIAYRDLKPENLLLTAGGNLKITDFGFAKVVDDKTWTLCGTPEYLAPEIIQSKGHNQGVDWWGLGILIYEMLAGFPPFYDDNAFNIYQKILAGRIQFPRGMDAKAKDLIKRLLQMDCSSRLGCLRNGGEDVKSHRWFGRTNWDAVFKCEVRPPYCPEVSGPADTRHFDSYPDSKKEAPARLTAQQRQLFDEFDRL